MDSHPTAQMSGVPTDGAQGWGGQELLSANAGSATDFNPHPAIRPAWAVLCYNMEPWGHA